MQDRHLCWPSHFSLAPQCPPHTFSFQNRHWRYRHKRNFPG